MNELTNEKKLNNYKKRKILRIIIIISSLTTIVLSILSLIIKLNIIYALLGFIITTVLTKYRNSLKIK